MKTLHDFATSLKASQKAQRVTAVELADRLGLSAQAVRQMLAGTTAPRLTNAMALADELGLELVLVPKEIAQSLSQPAKADRATKSDVERLLSGEPPNSARGSIHLGWPLAAWRQSCPNWPEG